MDLRPTAAEDLLDLHEVFGAAIGELYRRHNLEAPGPPVEIFVAQQGHVLRHDAERCWVAETGGRIVGFVAAIAREDDWFLSSLFVAPEAQAGGVGRALLERAWGAFPRRRTLTDAIQPVSNGLYAGRGLIPVTPALHLGGTPSIDAPEGLEPGEPDRAALRTLDLAAYGFDRAVDHAFWSRIARCTVWLRDGEPVAYAYVFPGGRLGPVAGLTGADAADAVRAELARSSGPAALVVPGSAREIVAAALEARLRFVRVPGLLLLSPRRPGSNEPRHLGVDASLARYHPGVIWEIVFMLVILKLPVVYLCAVVWWAIRATPEPLEGAALPAEIEPPPPLSWWRRRTRRGPRRGGPHGSPTRSAARAKMPT